MATDGHRKTIAVTAGLRLDGIIVPRIIDGAMDGDAFRTYVERVLIAGPRPGNIVITDNRPAHEVRGARKMIEAAGAWLRDLPPYFPDFTLIENAFTKLKILRRAAAARAVPDLLKAINSILERRTPSEC
ncbi:transposase [Acidiphilium sp.]|uniref:transposase n=1 Tax=Acidiphilium sp. TaxID=527 RepID=UPI003D080938